MTVLGRLSTSTRSVPLTYTIRGFSAQTCKPLLFSCTTKRSTKITSSLVPTSLHFRAFSSKPTPTSSTQPVYSQTDDTLTDTAREITPITPTNPGISNPISTDVDVSATTEAASKTGEALSSFPPVNWLADALTWVHHATGMPWWVTIIVATTTVRICMFPVMGHVMRNNLRMAALKPMMDQYSMKARMGATPEARAQATKDLYAYMARNGVNPIKSFLPILAQAPIFMLFYFTLKHLTENNIAHMDLGGTLWFTNLTIPDPYYILSIITAAMFISSVELGAETGQSMAKQTALIKNVFRFMGIVFIPITATFQAGLLVYWAFNSFLSLVQMMIFRIPAVRRVFNLPKPATSTSKVQIPDVIYNSPPGSKDRKAINNIPKKYLCFTGRVGEYKAFSAQSNLIQNK